jgi:uncharacterized glyoxalase superfamily protein PhnB
VKYLAVLAAAIVAGGIGDVSVAGRAAATTKEHTMTLVTRATAILHVERVEPSIRFWTDRLGFEKTIEVPEGDKIGFALLTSGATTLMYQTYSGMKADAANPLAKAADQGPSFVFLEVPDINAIASAMHGADIVVPMHQTPYGAKEIVVREPGGHYVIFSQLPPQP